MSRLLPDLALPRPAPAATPGPLDERLYDLVEDHARRHFAANPVLASQKGIRDGDGELGDGTRDAMLESIAHHRAHLAALQALPDDGLSDEARFERDLELHNTRLALFDMDDVRRWEQATGTAEHIGDAIFLLFARGAAPLADRLERITQRLERIPDYVEGAKTRLVRPPVRTWQLTEARFARDLPSLFADVRRTAERTLEERALARLDRAIGHANEHLEGYGAWLRDHMGTDDDPWQLGAERYSELVRLRAFGDLDTERILAIGEEQLATSLEARRAAARDLDPDADFPTVLDRLKNDHPPTFEAALDGYRDAMRRARAHIIEHDLATIPDDEVIEVVETPEFLRSTMPFAAYYEPAPFDADQTGIYVVTRDVDGDPNSMREHYWAAISNTSIHEAYPGHHLQLVMANRTHSLSRLLAEAPEFVEGWGMYCEQLMREHGFDDGPAFRMAMHTDIIWRAVRVILDIRMHRGDIDQEDATHLMVEHTGFERSVARAEVRRYTYTPGYQLSYLIGKVLILGLREEEKRRRGDAFSLKAFHDTLLRNGSLPISFHRRLLREGR